MQVPCHSTVVSVDAFVGLQDQMVNILREVLGQHLFVPEAGQLAKDGKWLSPEALKHKVVLRMKVKPGEGTSATVHAILAGIYSLRHTFAKAANWPLWVPRNTNQAHV